ncbi:hypothetical protein HD806DRAFT_509464 [Xylariaceae sp. AK1471]|nr:hypothetical protein HD806DRAFT_509464 [Xylariaceae sp. AK1471]
MKFLAAIAITHLRVACAAALPPQIENRQFYVPCPDLLYREALCCEQNVLGQDTVCSNLWPPTPFSANDFQRICSQTGLHARCCVEPTLGGFTLCTNPPGLPPGPLDPS